MKYFKALGFYFSEFVGCTLNLLCSLVGVYPSFDLGISFLLFFEGKRIHVEQQVRSDMREEKEREALALETKAKENE